MSADTVIDCNTYLGANLYLYCYSDPVNYVDTDGCLPNEWQYNTSYSLENQHWNKYRYPYEKFDKNTWQQSVSSLNITIHERQIMTGLQRFMLEIAALSRADQIHTTYEYMKQIGTIISDIGIGAGIVTFLSTPELVQQ